jgi:glycosyltransferase involved in cell wall biosynthesis
VGTDRSLLIVHQFALPRVSGVSVLVAELLRLVPEVAPGVLATAVSYEPFSRPCDLIEVVRRDHADATCVVGINLHIEVGWQFSVALAEWCHEVGKPLHLHVHDYWPHHREGLRTLTHIYGATVWAITPAICAALSDDDCASRLLPVGVAVPEAGVQIDDPAPGPQTIASVGRLVPRKRFPDIVRAFRHADMGEEVALYIRVPPSLVYSPEEDAECMAEIEAEARGCPSTVCIDPHGRLGTDYTAWSVYVSASEYEGLSMTPIESVLQGCPPLVSDIPPHRVIVETLFPTCVADYLFPVGDWRTLAGLLRDEVLTRRRKRELLGRLDEVQDIANSVWSLRTTAVALAGLTDAAEGAGGAGL